MNYNYFYIYLQNLKMGANDASGERLQSAVKNKHQNIFLRKLQAFEVRYLLFSVKITRQF